MSVLVVLNSVELLVDLMRSPGQLLPRSNKEIFMSHISALLLLSYIDILLVWPRLSVVSKYALHGRKSTRSRREIT